MERLEDGDDEELVPKKIMIKYDLIMIKCGNYDYLVPGGLGDVLQDDHSEGLHQRHALSDREGDVDAPARRKGHHTK